MTTIIINDGWPQDPRRLRELGTWYREFAERTGNPTIWEARLRTAAELEKEAARLEEASDWRRCARHVDCDCDADPGVTQTGSRRRTPSAKASARLRAGSLSS
jgi:hypothetical protein